MHARTALRGHSAGTQTKRASLALLRLLLHQCPFPACAAAQTYLPLIPLKYDFLLRRSGRRLGPYGTRKDVGISLDGVPADNHV